MPKFNPISISGYHMQEAGATPALELAYTLADGLEYIKTGCDVGLSVDAFAPRLSFFFCIGMDFFEEIAKLRAARTLWAELIKERFVPKSEKSLILRTHCQTSGYSLTSKDVYNNIIRTTIEATAAVLGGTQSLHTNAFDEALALPTPFSASIARATQLILRDKAGFCDAIDPFCGAREIEHRTKRLIQEARTLIAEIDAAGGMTKAIEQGIPMRNIERAALKAQSEIESVERVIVGVNAYLAPEEPLSLLAIDSQSVETAQKQALKDLKARRNTERVTKALQNLETAAQEKRGILEAAIEAAKERATLGEISDTLERVFGRYEKQTRFETGVYQETEGEAAETLQRVRRLTQTFQERLNRKPKILIAKVGQDGHDRGQKVIASAFQDFGFDVIMGALFQTPEEVADRALQDNVDLVGLSSMTAGHKVLAPQVHHFLRKKNSEAGVIVGGIIPPEDIAPLLKEGILAVFPANSNIAKALEITLRLIAKQLDVRLDNTDLEDITL